MIIYIAVLILLLLIVALLITFKPKKDKISYNGKKESTRPCPICHWPLKPKERVHSVVYRSENDNIMHIFGCPYCYKDHPKSKYKKELKRICPSCNRELKGSEYAVARLFEKPEKNHVHVLGCYRCRGKR